MLGYRTGELDDGLSGKEGTFVICSFWLALIEAAARIIVAELVQEYGLAGSFSGSSGGGSGVRIDERPDGP